MITRLLDKLARAILVFISPESPIIRTDTDPKLVAAHLRELADKLDPRILPNELPALLHEKGGLSNDEWRYSMGLRKAKAPSFQPLEPPEPQINEELAAAERRRLENVQKALAMAGALEENMDEYAMRILDAEKKHQENLRKIRQEAVDNLPSPITTMGDNGQLGILKRGTDQQGEDR
jgi:hypothetical protein